MEIYKKKQGLWVRWGTFICLLALLSFGSYRFYKTCFPDDRDSDNPKYAWLHQDLIEAITIPLIDIDVHLTWRVIFSVGLALIFLATAVGFIFINARTSEFLIETESEMRKVSWPTFKEVTTSSTVVIITMIILALYLYVADVGLNWIFLKIFSTKG